MSMAKTAAIILIGMLLFSSVAVANTAIAADRTAFDSDYVVETMDDEGTFEAVGDTMRAEMVDEINASMENQSIPQGISLGELDAATLANDTITDEFVKEEMTVNIDRLYAYLHGDTDELRMVVNLSDLKTALATEVSNELSIDTAAIAAQTSERITEDDVRGLSESEQSYQDAQLDLSEQERQQFRAQTKATAEEETANESENVSTALVDLQLTVVDGLTGQLSHEEYVEQKEADEARLKDALTAEMVKEVPDEQTLLGDEEDPAAGLGQLRLVVQWTDLLSWLLPLVSVALVGGLYAVTRSGRRTARKTGGTLLWVGVVGAVTAIALQQMLSAFIDIPDEAGASAFMEGMIAVFQGMFDTLLIQSVLLLVLGAIVYGLVLAEKRGHLDDVKERLGMGDGPRYEN